MRLKIMTYNIHGARGVDGLRDYARIGALLAAQNIDIALIQELDTRPENRGSAEDIRNLMTDHFPHFAFAPTMTASGGWYGNAVLSRFPILKEQVLDISSKGREPRNILEVFIQTNSGPLHIVNTHKGLGILERGKQIRQLNEFLSIKSDVPLIVGGDINEWHTYAGALRKLNLVLHQVRFGPTFPTAFPVLRLDRMWCRPWTMVKSSQVLRTSATRLYSDHYPLILEIEL